MSRRAGSTPGTPAGTPAGTPSRSAAAPTASAPAIEAAVDDPADSASAPVTVGTTSGSSTLSRRPPWWLWAVLAALAVAATVLALLLLLRPDDDELRDSALTAAERYTQSLTSYDARTLDEDVARVKRVAAPEFASEYERTITDLREQISSGQLVSVGTVVGRGIERLDDGEAVVLVAVDQQVTQAGQSPRTEANRVRITLQREDGRWLLAGVERL